MGGSVLIIKHLNLSPHRLISGTVGLFNILQTYFRNLYDKKRNDVR